MGELLVSICVPTYNGARYLRECLDSAIGQTHRSVEILVVDDASSDETPDIATEYARADGRVRLLRNPRRLGLVGNWNRSMELARGAWVKFLFQDDVLAPACVEKMIAAAHPAGPPIIACWREIVFEDASEATRRWYERHTAEESLRGVFPGHRLISAERMCDAALDHLGENFVGEPTAVLLKRSVHDEFGSFNGDLIAIPDLEYWIRVGSNTGLAVVPETLATFRVHPGSASSDNARSHLFRMQELDSAILLHEFAYRDAFTALRAHAIARNRSLDLASMFAQRAQRARSRARRALIAEGSFDRWAEWSDVASRYPAMRSSSAAGTARLRRLRRRVRSSAARVWHRHASPQDVAP